VGLSLSLSLSLSLYIYIYRVNNDVTITIVASGGILFVIIPRKTIHFGSNPRNVVSQPKDNSDMNIMNLIAVVSLFVIMVWLMNDSPDSLISDTTVSVICVCVCVCVWDG
jgi:hypothetical protein